jgi:hypothetical protein
MYLKAILSVLKYGENHQALSFQRKRGLDDKARVGWALPTIDKMRFSSIVGIAHPTKIAADGCKI